MDKLAAMSGTTLWSRTETDTGLAKYVFVIGGYHNPDNGGTFPWGDTAYSKVRFIGDNMGTIVLEYSDGSKDEIPLMYGYTLWWNEQWNMASLPFKGEGADENLSKLLKDTLYLEGGYEGNKVCAFKIVADSGKILEKILLLDNEKKDGEPVIHDVVVYDALVDDTTTVNTPKGVYQLKPTARFFDTHTIDSKNPLPDEIKNNLNTLLRGIATTEEDWLNAPEYTYSDEYQGPEIYFTGTPYANIANGVIEFGITDLATRADESGLFSESLSYTEQYLYGAFGTYNMGGAYTNRMWSRNKAMLVLNAYGFTDRAEHTLNYVNKQMMYFPERDLKIFGISIPGHFTINIDDPMHYRNSHSTLTQFSDRVKFGRDAWNLSNMEQDGHGMMMLSNWSVWKNRGSDPEWVRKNWKYIKEAAEWIVWCFEHEDITLCQNNVLYAESEGVAGWMGYSLYCNEPCYLGLLAYIEMAQSAGMTEEVARWSACAETFGQGILNYFTNEDGSWNFTWEGKDRDPALAYMRYLYGYDTADMNQDWLARTKKSYAADVKELLETNGGYWGAWGTGYDHCTILQNALLLDQMKEATILMNNLSKICYSPRHPDPYGVPEAFAVDPINEVVRRTGDFENQIHLSEAMSVYLLSMGVSPVVQDNQVLKIMPRLAEEWNVSVDDFTVEHTNSRIAFATQYPKDGRQEATVTFHSVDKLKKVRYRFGPFDMATKSVNVTIGGKEVKSDLVTSGDSKWAWITFDIKEGKTYNMIATASNTNSHSVPGVLIGAIAALACVIVGGGATMYIRRKNKNK